MILIQKGEQIELWTALTKLCDAHKEFSYTYLVKFKFPFTYKGWTFEKKEVN